LVEALIDDLEGCLAEADLDEPVEVVVGDYPSPTLLIDGIDVATRRAGGGSAAMQDGSSVALAHPGSGRASDQLIGTSPVLPTG